MDWLAVLGALSTLINVVLGWWTRHKHIEAYQLKIDNARLQRHAEMLADAMGIEDEIRSLTDDELIERLQSSPYRRD